MKNIDLETWPRRAHYEFFRAFDKPFFDVAARIDVTALVEFTRRTQGSLFAALMHSALRAATATENLRYRFRGEKVFEVQQCQASFTFLNDDETFNYATAIFDDDLETFTATIRDAAEQNMNRGDINLSDDHRLELVYVTSMPWLDFTSITHPFMGDPDDCAPRIAWGKVVESGDPSAPRWETTVQLTAHHALVDGLHAARFFKNFEASVADLGS